MAPSWTIVVVTLTLLVVAVTARSSRETTGSHLEQKVLSALKGVSQALDHFENTTIKALKFHKQNSDVLHHSLRILRQNSEVLTSLWRLPSNIKEELNEQNVKIIELVKNATSNVERLARENEHLKTDLESKDKKMQQLQENLEIAKEENGRFVTKVHGLEKNVKDTLREVEELRQREEMLNITVTSQSKLIKDIHPLVVQHNVTKLVSEFERTKRWKSLRLGLEEVLDAESLVYAQLRNVSYDDDGPLWTVGFHGYEELAVVLLSGGRHPDLADGEGCTLLHGAAQGGHVKLATTLLNRGASTEARGGRTRWTPLVYAARWDRLAVAKLLKERGADLDAATGDGETALHWAAWEGHLEVVRYLVAAGASTTARNHWGRTPLENARLHGQTAVVEYLHQFRH